MKCTRCGKEMRLFFRSKTKYRCTARCEAIRSLEAKEELMRARFKASRGEIDSKRTLDYDPHSQYHGCSLDMLEHL